MSAAPNPGPCEIGRIYGQYRIISVLGEVVYLAQHMILKQEAAFKVLKAKFRALETFVNRFRAESRALAELQHPNIARVYYADEHPEIGPYMAMEVLEGKSLAQLMAKARLPPKWVFDIVLKVIAALAYVHRAGIIHRDIKPSNLLLMQRDGVTEVKLLDFGAAKTQSMGMRRPLRIR
jgi:eukaryotic-like serine/threonine-protein kinase